MDYKRFENTIIVRIDRGEEILTTLAQVGKKEKVTLGHVRALGATNRFTIGVYKPDEKKYYSNSFTGDYEIVGLTGTITTMDKGYYAHIHMSAGDEQGKVVGGHLNEAWVSVTCEMVIEVIPGRVERTRDEALGINLFDFNK